MLTDALQQRNVRLENSSLQIENLKYLLLSGFQMKRTSDERAHECNKLMAVLKSTNDEHEDLKYRYFEVQQMSHELRSERQQLIDLCELLKQRVHEKNSSATATLTNSVGLSAC